MSTSGSDAEATSGPIDDLADFAIFAPLGLALEYRKLAPDLAAAGRKQVAFARTLGRAALKTMATSAARKSQGPQPAATQPSSTSAPKPAPAKSAAVDGYDTMTAKEIIAVAATATPAQIGWMTKQEQAGKQRKTVLAKLRQLSD